MPIMFELVLLALVAYATGFGLGWLFWGRPGREEGENST